MADVPRLAGRAGQLLAEDRALANASSSPARDASIEAAMNRVQARIDASLATGVAVPQPTGMPPPVRSVPLARSLTLTVLGGALLFGAGVMVGRSTRPEVTSAPLPTPSASVTAAPSASLTAVPVAPASVDVSTPPVASATPKSVAVSPRANDTNRPSSAPDRQLQAERALLDRARRALQAGRPADALEALREHRALTSDAGQLAEERDALEVHALAGEGDLPLARAAAARFEARYPASLFAPSVKSAVADKDEGDR